MYLLSMNSMNVKKIKKYFGETLENFNDLSIAMGGELAVISIIRHILKQINFTVDSERCDT